MTKFKNKRILVKVKKATLKIPMTCTTRKTEAFNLKVALTVSTVAELKPYLSIVWAQYLIN